MRLDFDRRTKEEIARRCGFDEHVRLGQVFDLLWRGYSIVQISMTLGMSPAGSYENGEKYCLVIAQAIPDATIINAPVVITIGTGTATYPLTKRNCAQVTAAMIRTRTRYSTRVVTTSTGGAFRLMGAPCCAPRAVRRITP